MLIYASVFRSILCFAGLLEVKALVVRTGSLFGHDETRWYADRLCRAIAAAGNDVETTSIPFSTALADVVSQTLAYRLFDLRHGADLCIALGPFSHALQHDNKRAWVLSQYGPLTQHWNTPYGAVTASYTNLSTRAYVNELDRAWLSEARLVYAASATVASSLSDRLDVRSTTLLPAPLDALTSPPSGYGDYFLFAGLLADTARVRLVIDAFGKINSAARLVLLGYQCSVEEREYVQQLITDSRQAAAITLELDPSEERFRSLVSEAAAFISVPYLASAADVFAIAAGASSKPLVTTTDSGAIAELVDDGTTGFAVDPDPTALADALDRLFANRALAKRFGTRLSEKLRTVLPTWEYIAAELTK